MVCTLFLVFWMGNHQMNLLQLCVQWKGVSFILKVGFTTLCCFLSGKAAAYVVPNGLLALIGQRNKNTFFNDSQLWEFNACVAGSFANIQILWKYTPRFRTSIRESKCICVDRTRGSSASVRLKVTTPTTL